MHKSPEIEQPEILPEINFGHFVEQRPHPETGELVDCLIIYIPDHHSLSLLKTDGGPSHYTPKVVHLEGLDVDDKDVSIGADALSIGGRTKEIPIQAELIKLGGIFSVRLNDANPPLDPSGQEISGKTVHYLIENNSTSKLVATVRKAKWIDRTVNSSKRELSEAVICQGSSLLIYGEVNQVNDPWDIPNEPRLSKYRAKTQQIFDKWNKLKIEKAKRGAEERRLYFRRKGAI